MPASGFSTAVAPGNPVALAELENRVEKGALVQAKAAEAPEQRADAHRAAAPAKADEDAARLAGGVEAMQGIEGLF